MRSSLREGLLPARTRYFNDQIRTRRFSLQGLGRGGLSRESRQGVRSSLVHLEFLRHHRDKLELLWTAFTEDRCVVGEAHQRKFGFSLHREDVAALHSPEKNRVVSR